jgi:uncharacterized membrane protein YagU involved in acid resistance
MRDSRKLLVASIAGGVVGGLAASAAMNAVQWIWAAVGDGDHRPKPDPQQQKSEPDEEQSATRKLARLAAEKVAHKQLTRAQQAKAGAAVHYAFGAAAGGLYGVACAASDKVGFGRGVPFGAAVWALGDELAVPALGLTKPVTEFPLSKHAYTLTAHLVYGYVTETIRRAVVESFAPDQLTASTHHPSAAQRAKAGAILSAVLD